MKVMVRNYTSETSTEPMYLCRTLRDVGQESFLWGSDISAFDAFDIFKPDFLVDHFGMIDKGTIKRLSEGDTKLVLNVTGATQEALDRLSNLDLEILQMYQNFESDLDVPVIRPSADIFIQTPLNTKYKIDHLFIVSSQEELDHTIRLINHCKKCHVITTVKSFEDHVDAYVPLMKLPSIHKNYNHIYTARRNQAYYDAAYCNGECNLVKDNKIVETTDVHTVIEKFLPSNFADSLFGLLNEKLSENIWELIGKNNG